MSTDAAGTRQERLKRSKTALADYERAFKDSHTPARGLRGLRGSATIGLTHDQKDKIKLKMPLLALWRKQGVIEALFDCLAD